MKFGISAFFLLLSLTAFAEGPCDVRPGTSVGVKVFEFASGNTIHSKMTIAEGHAEALMEEMTNLQDMGICSEKILAQKCILKFEKQNNNNFITLYRGTHKWISWVLKSKDEALNYVKDLKRTGFCS